MKIPIRSSMLAALALLPVLVLPATASVAAPAHPCAPEADDLSVTYQPVDHTVGSWQYFRAQLTLKNNDHHCALGGGDWALYFNWVRRPLAVYPPGDLGDPA